MRFAIRLCRSVVERVRGNSAPALIDKLARENAEDVQASRRLRSSKGNIQDVKSQYQFDLLHGDDTANKMMLQ